MNGMNENQLLRTIYLITIHSKTPTRTCSTPSEGVFCRVSGTCRINTSQYVLPHFGLYGSFLTTLLTVRYLCRPRYCLPPAYFLPGIDPQQLWGEGWGGEGGKDKNSGPLPLALALSVHSGTTRNMYIGNMEDVDSFSGEPPCFILNVGHAFIASQSGIVSSSITRTSSTR